VAGIKRRRGGKVRMGEGRRDEKVASSKKNRIED